MADYASAHKERGCGGGARQRRTIASAAHLLKKQGAKFIIVAATHGIFYAPSHKILSTAPIDKIRVSDTLSQRAPPHARVVSIARHLADAL